MSPSALGRAAALLGLLLAGPGAAEQAPADGGCARHELTPAVVKEELRRWSGLGPFAQWKLAEVSLEPCVRDGQVAARLELAPPEKWSRRGLPYRLRLGLALDEASGDPLAEAPAAWRAWPAEVKRLVTELEADEDALRFLERHGAVRVELRPGEGGAGMLAAVLTDPGPQQPVERGAAMGFRLGAKGSVVSYQLARMDAWPARPELLRFLEVLSQRHPRCRPVWIEARVQPAPPVEPIPRNPAGPPARVPPEPPPPWTVRAELLAAADCPASFQAAIAPDGVVADVLDGASPDESKGD
ncbi:MAG TPA: hypothetical protein PK668_03550 [Myxococcota bacterium]|nr:hypothetical protein [Myxococcota bacterium]HRY91931.1 hypothetical protein [Myxococcota bacterium]HSA22284.1 hypothetical protein [Myxococcota bacterium]